MSLVPVHGGLAAPVDRVLKLSRRKALQSEAAAMPKIQVTSADLATVHRIADGTLSPLTGPMTEAQWNKVLDQKCIESNGKNYAWTIPLALPVTDDEAAKLKVGSPAAVYGPDGALVGVVDVKSVYGWDKDKYVQQVYRTARFDHPGGKIAKDDTRTKLVGGDLSAFPARPNPSYGHLVLTPLQTRALIASRKWDKAVAFQTRNPLHRAHEYALVYGLEQLTREGHFAGAVLNPLVGELKGDDVDAPTRMLTYVALKTHRLMGQGDSDPALWEKVGYELNDVFELVGLDIKMFYGGPSEAVMHAIYRQNHGFSHIVVGRKHADAPYDDKSAIWGDFDAQEIFDALGGELHTKPVKVGFAAYYDSANRVDLMENHKGEQPYSISGTKIREMLVGGEVPPEKIMRKETAAILIEAYKKSS
ncbi:MAG: sulfate adenylyltransferase [Myxococcota bacterium]